MTSETTKRVLHGLGLGILLGEIVPVIRLEGRIAPGMAALSLQSMERPIARAFALPRLQTVALVVNSPGGSAAQSHLLARRIRSHADENKVRVVSFVEDAAASGGYFLACAGDEIVADPFSVVGSIGVIHSSFGLHDAIHKIGVTRRVYTAGKAKSRLDPFKPEDPSDVAKIKTVLESMHDEFMKYVKERRAGKLKASDDELFNGDFWTAKKGLELGLVDELGEVRQTVLNRYGEVWMPVIKRSPFGLDGGGLVGAIAGLGNSWCERTIDMLRDKVRSGEFSASEEFDVGNDDKEGGR